MQRKAKPVKKKENSSKEVANRTKNAGDAYTEGMLYKKKYEESDHKNQEDILAALDKFTTAITQITTSTGQDRQAQIHANYMAARGQCYMLIKDYQKALFDFTIAIKQNDKESSYFQSRGNCQLQLGHISEALQDFQSAIKIKSTEGLNYLNRALVHTKLQNYKKAIEDFDSAIKMIKDNSASFKCYLHRGNCYRYQKLYELSIADLIKACDLIKTDASAQNSLGLSYFENKQYDMALERFSKAIELFDQNATYYNNKALALYHNNQYQLSLQECNKAIKLDPKDARIYYNRGNCFLALGKFQEAHQDLDRSIALDSKNPKFYHSKGLAFQGKDYKKAIQYFELALKVDPKNIPSLYHLGLMQHKNGMLTDALQSLTKVLQVIGQDRLVLESRGLVYQDNKSHAKAIDDFTKAIQLQPHYAEVYYFRGLSKIEMTRLGEGFSYQDAINDFKRGSELGSTNPGIFSGIGQAFRLLKDYDKALYYLNQALKKDQFNIQFLIQRSNIYVDIKEYTSAIEDLSLALSKKSNDPQILYRRGIAFFKNNQFHKCIKDLKDSFANKPYETYQPDIHYHLGIAYAHLQQHEMAIDPLSKAIQLSPNQPYYYHQRAKSLLRIGQFQNSVNDFFTVLNMQPRNANAYFGRAFGYKALKRFDEAAADFQRAKELDPFNPKLIINPKKIYEIPYILLCKPGEQAKQRQDNFKH